MWSDYGQKSLQVAVQSGKGHICFTKPFLLKMGCEISGWRFFCAGFYCIDNCFMITCFSFTFLIVSKQLFLCVQLILNYEQVHKLGPG